MHGGDRNASPRCNWVWWLQRRSLRLAAGGAALALGAGEPPGSPEPPPLVRCADERFALDQKKFAEPVSLSSTASADFPLPSCDGPVLPSDSVSTYLRSVLGAISKLRNARGTFKGSKQAVSAICGFFFFQYFHSFFCSCG